MNYLLLGAQPDTQVAHHFSRLNTMTEWWQWFVLFAGAVVVVVYVAYMYRRDCIELSRGLRWGLFALRLAALAGILFQYEAGLERMNSYLTRFSKNWTMNFASIGAHYLGLEELRQGRKQAGLERLQRAFAYNPLETTADAIAEITGVRPPMKTPRWTDKPFPVQYTLPTIEGEKKTVGLAPALQAMGPGKLLVVCVLANYRSNGPYYELLNRYHNYATHFAPFLEGLHVLTTEPKRYPHRAYHYAREDEVRALGLPFEVLLEEGEVVGALLPSGSPFVLRVDHQGTIVYEGQMGLFQEAYVERSRGEDAVSIYRAWQNGAGRGNHRL